MTSNKTLNYFSIFISVIGIGPLAILGLITPSQQVAFLIGISDFVFAGIIAVNCYELGKKSR